MPDPAENPVILVIDDDADLRYSLKRVLSARNFLVLEAASGEEGLSMAAQHRPRVILLDNRMGGMSGIETLQHLRGMDTRAMIIVMTAFGTNQTTIEAMKYGAFDYILKPFDLKKILALTESALRASRDIDRAGGAVAAPAISPEDLEVGMIGRSPAMQEVFKMIGQVAASDATVMITGESGTGKELIARAIVRNSLRAQKPYLAVNCAAIPETLIESELFGHEKGAYTGAMQQHTGKFERCDGGTLFLDEIGDMTPATQTKILRVLQEGEIQRVGGNRTIQVNVRVLAATNKPLEAMVKAKTFREDLYYRLNVVRIHLPPLRERLEDVPQLVDFVLKRLAENRKTRVKTISPEALSRLCHYTWPGNIRELENLIYRSAVIAQSDTILCKDLPSDLVPPDSGDALAEGGDVSAEPLPPAPVALSAEPAAGDVFDAVFRQLMNTHGTDILARLEQEMIQRALDEAKGNQTRAAAVLGLNRATLRKRLDG